MRGLLTFILILINIAAAQQWEVGVKVIKLPEGIGPIVATWSRGDTIWAAFKHEKGLALMGIQNDKVLVEKLFELPKGFEPQLIEGLNDKSYLLFKSKYGFQLWQVVLSSQDPLCKPLFSEYFEEPVAFSVKYYPEDGELTIVTNSIKKGRSLMLRCFSLSDSLELSFYVDIPPDSLIRIQSFDPSGFLRYFKLRSPAKWEMLITPIKMDTTLASHAQDAVLLDDDHLLTADVRDKTLILKLEADTIYSQKLKPTPVQDYVYPIIVNENNPYVIDVYLNGYRKPHHAFKNANRQKRLRLQIDISEEETYISVIKKAEDKNKGCNWGNHYVVGMGYTVQGKTGQIQFLDTGQSPTIGVISYSPCLYVGSPLRGYKPLQRLFISSAVPGKAHLTMSRYAGTSWVIPVQDRKWLRLVYCTPPAKE